MKKLLLTGVAQRVTDSVPRAMAALNDRPSPRLPARPPKKAPQKPMRRRQAAQPSIAETR
jgi:hypothetical protein